MKRKTNHVHCTNHENATDNSIRMTSQIDLLRSYLGGIEIKYVFSTPKLLYFKHHFDTDEVRTTVKMFPIWLSGDKIAIFQSSWINKLFPREWFLTFPRLKNFTFSLTPVLISCNLIVEGIFSFNSVTLKSSTTTIRVGMIKIFIP